ncbi:phosphatase [Paenibacillus sp. Root52]|uniref:Cof subfamily protein (Haloacid dehalogenase superfamily) n=1 Tax=Paenibacillus amylolyticus TaxID=1451 RepID=A0AAP5H3J7_PAEAM|nr:MULTISPECIES: Cof-type HAD-IIB family hydrolase [Paenibacillus]KQY84297.1 phosphatase [Paenibacillus sp. Root52]MDR6724108.1 Cof subfamily protein (haloacid dehalogenase superfamily) [Paenibacillus amylolyticus]
MKLFATDLDGTLLNRDSQISPENAAAIHRAQQEGLRVTIATGRVYSDVVTISLEGGIKTPVIGSNGATIHDENGERLFHLPLERETAASVMQWLEDHDCYYEASTQQGIYAPINSHNAMLAEMDRILGASPSEDVARLIRAVKKHYDKKDYHRVNSHQEIPAEAHIYNIMAFSMNPDQLREGRQYFAARSDVAMVVSSEHNFEMQHPDVSKGNALSKLAAHLNIAMEDTVSIGDNFNDVSMLQMAGLGIAMGNAEPEIKALAKAITLTNVEHGVAHAIYSVLEGKPINPPAGVSKGNL